jgi:tRNA(Arg) A34 adenosine deaminase TadA
MSGGDAAGSPLPDTLTARLPSWVPSLVAPWRVAPDDDAMAACAIALSRENVVHGTGGPFGAAVFDAATGRLVAVGVNLVESRGIAALHAEVVALSLAQVAIGTYSLSAERGPAYVLATSCAPCAMCIGAIHWSGVSRVIVSATREDAEAVGFDEGPVFPESVRYLERNGVTFVSGVRREEARAVLAAYRARGGVPYNG